MNCPFCGAENAPESKFCIGCGSPIAVAEPVVPEAPVMPEAPVATEAPAQSAPSAQDIKDTVVSKAKSLFANKAVLYGILGVVALLAVVLIIGSLFSGGNGFIEVKEEITYFKTDDNEYSIVVGKKVLKQTIETEEGIVSFKSNLDGKIAVALTGDDDLYTISGSKVKKVAEDVTGFILSVNGKGVAYTVHAEDDEFTSLYLLTVSNSKASKVTDELGSSYSISPDGKSVAYFKDGGEDEADELMLFKGKKSTAICDDEGARLYGLSNNGKHIYVSIPKESDGETETILYSFNNKGKKEKLETIKGSVSFNDDHTQIMFQDDEGRTFISTKGKAAKKVRSESMTLLIAPGSTSMGNTYPVSNLYGHVYQSNGGLYMIKKNKEIKLASKASQVQLDASGEYVYYIYDSEELRVAKISHGEKAGEKAKTIVDEYVGYIVTYNRKYVYFSDNGTNLMAVNGKKGGTAREITDELDGDVALSKDNKLYYTMDGDLYVVTNGKKGKKVLSDVDDVWSSDNGYIYAEGDDKAYVSTGSKKPKQILDLDN